MQPADVILNLEKYYHENKLAHAYLLETNNIDMCYKDIIELIKRINCPNEYINDCACCNLCHLVDNNILPSLIVVRPIDKTIKKEAIDNLKKSFSMVPIYTKNNIYIIVSPEKMNNYSYNKMLKFLEEPEDNIMGFYITNNADKVASTIVSRLEKLTMKYSQSANEADDLDLSKEDCNRISQIANKYASDLYNNINYSMKNIIMLLKKEILNRNELFYFLKTLYSCFMKKFEEENKEMWHNMTKICLDYLEKNNFNGNISLLIDSFVIEIGELYGK